MNKLAVLGTWIRLYGKKSHDLTDKILNISVNTKRNYIKQTAKCNIFCMIYHTMQLLEQSMTLRVNNSF
jgi:hypothetical protein